MVGKLIGGVGKQKWIMTFTLLLSLSTYMSTPQQLNIMPIQLPKPSGLFKKNLVKKIRNVLDNLDIPDGEIDNAFPNDAQLASINKTDNKTL